MIAKRTPSAPPIDLVLSILYVAQYRLPGDDVSGSSVSRPSKPGQVGHVFILQPSRSSCALIATLSIPRPRTKTDRSAGSGWQLEIRFDKYRANGNSKMPSAGYVSSGCLRKQNSRRSTSNCSPG